MRTIETSAFARMLGACLLVGSLWATPVVAQDIMLGQIGPFTGIQVPDAQFINQGAKAAVAQANKAGGIAGRKLVLFELDDGNTADNFVARFDELMKRKPVALISPWGSPQVKRMLDEKLLDRQDVVVMNAVPGSEAFRNPGHPRLFHVRASDNQKLAKIVNHARALGMSKIGVLYQNNPVGISSFKEVSGEAAKIAGFEVKGVSADQAGLTQAAQDLAAYTPQGVLVVGAPTFAAATVAELRKAGVAQTVFLVADMSPELLVKVAGRDSARGVGIVQIYPNPNSKTQMREFQVAMKAAYPDLKAYSPAHLEGYISTRVVIEGLRRIKGEITSAALARALQTSGEIDVDGYRLNFSRGNAGSQYVDIAVVDLEGRLRY